MNRCLVRCVWLAVGFLTAGAVFAQIPRSVMVGMMRSAIRPPTGGGVAPADLTWTVRDSSRDWTGAALSADGRRQTAVVQNGLIYVSTNYGVAWSPKGSAQSWQCVAMSADGARQTACIYDGGMYFSTDYGNTWTAGGESLCWVSVAMSADGARQTALEDNGYLYVSTDYGNTWTTKMDDASRNWRRVGMSTNGQYQTAVCEMKEDGDTGERYGGGIYVSSDYGATWILKVTDVDWSGVAVCGNGARQTVCGSASQMYVSTDYGATWTATDVARDWRCVSSSSDGTVQFAIVADNGIYKSTDFGATWNQAGPTQWWEYVTSSPGGSCHIAVVLGGGLWVAR